MTRVGRDQRKNMRHDYIYSPAFESSFFLLLITSVSDSYKRKKKKIQRIYANLGMVLLNRFADNNDFSSKASLRVVENSPCFSIDI